MHMLITGAAGHVATLYRTYVANQHQLRLLDIQSVANPEPHEVLIGRLDNLDVVRAACRGVEAVIHLGGDRRPEAPFLGSLLANNIVATHNVFTAAQEAGCRRVIFASSTHTTSALPGERRGITDDQQAPGNLYGVSKLYGESLGSYFAHIHGLSVICLRLGWVAPPVEQLRTATNWFPSAYLSARDLCQILDLSLTASLHFAVLNASSDNANNRVDLSRTRTLLGYAPQDRVEDVLRMEEDR